jgi:hypothetical protein
MIVYGWNSFVVGKYRPSDIGLDANMDQNVVFERRQKYAHLFWIPVFGIGKIWVLRKRNDGNQYKVNPDVEKVLEYKYPNHQTPWYTFALPVLAAGIAVIAFFLNMYTDYASHKRFEENEAKRIVEQTALASDAKPDTYIRLDGRERDVYLKVIRNDANALTCVVSRPTEYLSGDHAMLEAFINSETLDTASIAKADLLKTVDTNTAGFEGFEVLPGEGNSVMAEAKHFPYPVFASLGAAYDNGTFRAMVRNIGASGKFRSVDLASDKFQLESKFPDEIAAGDSVLMVGTYSDAEPRANGTLILDATSQSPVQYDLRIYGSRLIIKEKKND